MLQKRTPRLGSRVSPSNRRRRSGGVTADGSTAIGAGEDLPYVVELWNLPRTEVERVLGRANSAALAQAIFMAAEKEHLGRLITLRRGDNPIAESR